jgi:hypothetical protein
MPDTLHAAAIDCLAATPAALRALLEALPTDLRDRPADGDWAPRDVAAHLLLTNRIGALARMRTIVAEDEPSLLNNDEDEELRRSGLRERPPAEVLDEFARLRGADVAWLRGLDGAAFGRAGHHSVAGRVTVEEFLFHAAYHDELHLAQLARMIGAAFEPLRGGMRQF